MGARHSLALTEVGEVYSWGRGSAVGQGEKSHKKTVTEPCQVETLSSVQTIASGNAHSCAVIIEGSFVLALSLPFPGGGSPPGLLRGPADSPAPANLR